MQCLLLFEGQVIPYGWVWSQNLMDTSVHVVWRSNWRQNMEVAHRDNVAIKSMQAAWKSKQKVFCVLVMSCIPHVSVIPSFLPLIFQRHLPGAHIWLCRWPSCPNDSTLQTTVFNIRATSSHPHVTIIMLFPPSIFQSYRLSPSCG